MANNQDVALQQIDALIAQYDLSQRLSSGRGFDDLGGPELIGLLTRIKATVQRLAPPGTAYADEIDSFVTKAEKRLGSGLMALEECASVLMALRADYAAGHLRSIKELIHADVFSDFLEMADHLIEQGYKDAAAVIAGSVLEEHLRKLCDKNGIDLKKPDGTPKKADTMNSELAGANVYSKLDQKNITAWLDLRNKAAHGKYSEYTKDQVALLIQSVRDFITRNPA